MSCCRPGEPPGATTTHQDLAGAGDEAGKPAEPRDDLGRVQRRSREPEPTGADRLPLDDHEPPPTDVRRRLAECGSREGVTSTSISTCIGVCMADCDDRIILKHTQGSV